MIKQSITRILLSQWFHILLSALIWGILYAPFLPFRIVHVDTSVYIIGAKFVMNGFVPYLDFWDHKPPLVYFLYALVLKLFGSTRYSAINVLTLLFLSGTSAILYFVVRRLCATVAAFFAALLLPLISIIIISLDALMPNTEIYMQLFSLLTVYFGYRAITEQRIDLGGWAGIAIGIAIGFKQPAGVILIMLCGTAGVYGFMQKQPLRRTFWLIASFISGCSLVWIIITGYFLAHGALDEFWFEAFRFNTIYSSALPRSNKIRVLVELFSQMFEVVPYIMIPFIVAVMYMMIGLCDFRRPFKQRFMYLFVLLWNLMDLAGMSTSGIFYSHYLVQWLTSVVVIMVVGLYELYRLISRREWILSVIFSCYAAFLMVVIFTGFHADRLYRLWPFDSYHTIRSHVRHAEQKLGKKYYSHPFYFDVNHIYDIQNMVYTVKRYVAPDESLFIWGFMPEMYLMASRKPASRFLYNSLISGRFTGLGNIYLKNNAPDLRNQQQKMQALLLSDLRRTSPPAIVLTDYERNKFNMFFWDFLESHYTFYKDMGHRIELYLRNDITPH